MTYSQNDEQEAIQRYFGEFTGSLLDIGAFDGITFSNSRALLELGWVGVLIEPDPWNLQKLIANTLKLNCDVICAAVGPEQKLARLCIETTENRGWASTISEKLMRPDRILSPLPAQVYVPTLTLDNIMRLRERPFQFISIDAEGMDFEILKTMPKKMLAEVKLLSIEPMDLTQRAEIFNYLFKIGFCLWHETPENLLMYNHKF